MSSKSYAAPPPPTKPDTGTTEAGAVELAGAEAAAEVLALLSTISGMADAASLDERLEQIGTQLDWVRDYL